MQLSKLYETKQKLKLPNNFNGFAYKWIEHKNNNKPQHKITQTPGYVSLTPQPNLSYPIGLLYKIKIPQNLHPYQPKEPYITNNDYYDKNTTIKPGWLCQEMNENGTAEVAVITIPCEWTLIKAEKIS